MESSGMDTRLRFVNALRTQSAVNKRETNASTEANRSLSAIPDGRLADFGQYTREENCSSVEEAYAGSKCLGGTPLTNNSNKPDQRLHDSRLHSARRSARGISSQCRAVTDRDSNPPCDPEHEQKQAVSSDQQQRTEAVRKSTAPHSPGLIELQKHDPRYPGLLLQPGSRPISQEQLASEVKSIYAGLTMVETKCIHIDRVQAPAPTESRSLSSGHWQALIALHRTLLHEHHDFFLASQHPSDSPALRRLASIYTPRQVFFDQLNNHIGRVTTRWKKQGIHTALANTIGWSHPSVDLTVLHHFFLFRTRQHQSRRPAHQQTAGESQSAGSYHRRKALRDALQQPSGRKRFLDIHGLLSSACASIETVLRAWIPCPIIPTVFRNSHERSILSGSVGAWTIMAQIPVVSASTPSLAETPGSTQETLFDWIVTGSMVLYIISASIVNRRSRKSSLILMFTMATLWLPATDEKSLEGIRKTVLKIWLAGACHFVFQDCYTANDTTLHVVLYGILTALFASIGSNLPQSNLTKALPLSIALAAGVLALLFRVPEAPKRIPDPEQGDAGLGREV